jgi:apolipoprotein N-acyltransferase
MQRLRTHNLGAALVALAAGALTTLGFAPFRLAPLAILAPALLLWLWHRSKPGRALRDGWLYGVGLLGSGVSWLHISIDQFGNVGLALALIITAAFVLGVALFFGLAGWLGARLSVGHPLAALLLFWPALWVLVEWFRGWFLTGFPWLALGYAQIGWPLDGLAPLLGVYGVSWGAMLSAGALVLLVMGRPRHRLAAAAGLLGLWLAAWGLGGASWSQPAGESLRVSLVQGNVPQALKWHPEQLLRTLKLYVRLTRQHWDSDLVIWPETAVPSLAHRVEEEFLSPLAAEAEARGSEILLGIPVYDEASGRYYNAMQTVGPVRASYYKRHLVPFGEFMPLKPLLAPLIDWLAIPMSDFSPGDAAQPLVPLAGYQAGVSICYEDAFGEEVIQALPQAAFLVNASNDAWFGDSLAPHQHLQIARMRARETERYLLRATNTGISAIIGPRGELRGTAPAFTEQVLTGEIRPLQGLTPYARFGNWAVVMLVSMLVVIGLALERRITPRSN